MVAIAARGQMNQASAIPGPVRVGAECKTGAMTETVPAPATPSVSAEDGYALVLRPGEHLSRRSVNCPSGEFSVVHQHDGNVVVYRNADRFAVWASGTNHQRSVVNPSTVPTDALDRVYGRPGRLALEADGNLVVYSSAGKPMWTSRSAGRGVTALMIHDRGRLVLKTDRNTFPWSSDYPPARWDGWNNATDGRRLRRGQCLRGSLVSDNGEYAFVVGEGAGAYLCRTDGPMLWAVDTGSGEGYELTLDGRLVARTADGTERPADSLKIAAPTAAELAERGAAQMLVTDAGDVAIADASGAIIWTLDAPVRRRILPTPSTPVAGRRKPRIPPGVPRLPEGEDVPVVRTDFTDEAAWRDALARVTAEYAWGSGDPEAALPVTPIDDPRYRDLTPDQLRLLVPRDVDWPMLVVADAETMASTRRHLLLVNLDADSLGPIARATPAATVEMATNLWIGNMDWEDFAGDPDYDTYDPDQILEAMNIPEPE